VAKSDGEVWVELVGPFYSVSAVTRLLDISPEEVHRRVLDCSLWGLPTEDGVTVFPVSQFDKEGEVVQGLGEVLEVFSVPPVGPWGIALWMVTPSEDLGWLSPLDWLREGRGGTGLTPVDLAREKVRLASI